MKTKYKIGVVFLIVIITGIFFVYQGGKSKASEENFQYIHPMIGTIKKTVITTGTVNPQNRLEIKPPIAGRIEKMLVKEGQAVKIGDVLALMSSTERAALLDAALLKGDEELAYWQEVYKAAPLIAPIDGEVIVRSVEPGQTVTTSDVILVISDRLIVEADFDETDIGEIEIGQHATIELDAYSEIKVDAIVDHISYESEMINNVNIYSVDIIPESVPDVFRSGMSTNVEVTTVEKRDILVLPIDAVTEKNGRKVVRIKDGGSNEIVEVSVSVGIQDEEYYEILSGVSEEDEVLVSSGKAFSLKNKKSNGNPFMPTHKQK